MNSSNKQCEQVIPESLIRRVWPSSLLVQSACAVLRHQNSACKDAIFVLGVVWWHEVCKCKLTTICVHSAPWPFHDYLRMLVVMRWPHSPPSPGNTWPLTTPYSYLRWRHLFCSEL